MTKVVIIGQSSYLSQQMEEYLADCGVSRFSYRDWRRYTETLRQADYIINFCIQPEFASIPLHAHDIIEGQIAEVIENCATRMIFLSSRKIYGTSDQCKTYTESDEPRPFDAYSANKVLLERALTEKLGDRLAIARIPNVIGPAVYGEKNNTFIAWVSRHIKNNQRVSLCVDKGTTKDFITRDYLQEMLSSFIHDWAPGIWNVGSGIGVSVGELLDNMIGADNYDDAPGCLKDQFILDPSKLVEKTGARLTKEEILSACHENFRPVELQVA